MTGRIDKTRKFEPSNCSTAFSFAATANEVTWPKVPESRILPPETPFTCTLIALPLSAAIPTVHPMLITPVDGRVTAMNEAGLL